MSAGSVDIDAEPGYLRARVLRYWVCLELRAEQRPGRIPQQTAAYMQTVVARAIREGDPYVARAIAHRASYGP